MCVRWGGGPLPPPEGRFFGDILPTCQVGRASPGPGFARFDVFGLCMLRVVYVNLLAVGIRYIFPVLLPEVIFAHVLPLLSRELM